MVVHDFQHDYPRHLCPIEPTTRFLGHRIVVWFKNQAVRVLEIHRQLPLTVASQLMAVGARKVPHVLQGTSGML